MTHGANSAVDRAVMRERYQNSSFMHDAVKQLEVTLDGYIDGVPWDFGSKGLVDIAATEDFAEEDLLFQE